MRQRKILAQSLGQFWVPFLVFTQVELDTVLSDLEAADFEELVRRGAFPQRCSVEPSVTSHPQHLPSGLRALGLCFDTGQCLLAPRSSIQLKYQLHNVYNEVRQWLTRQTLGLCEDRDGDGLMIWEHLILNLSWNSQCDFKLFKVISISSVSPVKRWTDKLSVNN